MVPALLGAQRKMSAKTHKYEVKLDNGLTLEFTTDKLLNDDEIAEAVAGMDKDGTIEKMSVAAKKQKAINKAANEKQAAKMVKAKGDLEVLKASTKNAQRKAREASLGYDLGEKIIGAAKAVESNPAVKELNRIDRMITANLPGGRIVEAGINALPPEAKRVVKAVRDPMTLTSLVTQPAEIVGGFMSRPEKTAYDEYGVAFDPKADPVQRLAAGVNIVGTALGAAGVASKVKAFSRKLPSQAELKAIQDALTASKGSKATRAEASKAYQDLRKIADKKAKEDALVRAKGLAQLEKTEAEITAPPQKPKITGTAKADPATVTPKVQTATAKQANPTPSTNDAPLKNADPRFQGPGTAPRKPTELATAIDENKKTYDAAVAAGDTKAAESAKVAGQNLVREYRAALEGQRASISSRLEAEKAAGNAEAVTRLENSLTNLDARIGRMKPDDFATTGPPKPIPDGSTVKTPRGTGIATANQFGDFDVVYPDGAKASLKRGDIEMVSPPATPKVAPKASKAPPKVKTPGPVVTPKAVAGNPVTPTPKATTVPTPEPVVPPVQVVTPPAKPKTRNTKTVPPRDDLPGSARNEDVAALRESEGLAPVKGKESDPIAERAAKKNYNYDAYQRRMTEIVEQGSKARPLTDEEVLNWKNHRSEIARRIAANQKKIKDGDVSPETLDEADALIKQRDEADIADMTSGTLSSQSLSARRQRMQEKYSRENIEYQAIVANKGALSPAQRTKLNELIARQEKLGVEAAGQNIADEALRKDAEKFIKDAATTARRAGTKADRDAAWAELRQAVLRMGSKASAGIDPDDLVKIAKSIRKVARAYWRLDVDLDGLVKIVLEDTKRKFPQLANMDEEDILRALAGKEGDKSVLKRNEQDVRALATQVEIDNFMREVKLAAEQRSLHPAVKIYAEVGSFFRGVKAGFDASPVGNQGLYMWAMNPRASFRALKAFIRAAKSEEDFYRIMGELRTRDNYELAVASKLRANAINMAVDEVPFSSKLLDRFPFSKAANRAYNAYQNVVRVEAFDDMLNAISDGKPTLADADIVAEFVNTATGAGTGDLAGIAAKFNAMTMNTALFSSGYRIAKGKFSMMTPLANALMYGKKSGNYKPAIAIAKKYGQLLAAYGALYSAIIASGGKVDFAPDSPNQFKVRLLGSDVWVDPTGGLYGFLQALYQTFNGSKKLAKDKASLSVKKDGTYAKNEAGYSRLSRYIEGGMGPVPRAAMGLWTGKSFGKDLSPKTQRGRINIATTLLLPIWGEQSAEMVQDKKLPDAMKVAAILFSFGGIPSDARGVEIPRQ